MMYDFPLSAINAIHECICVEIDTSKLNLTSTTVIKKTELDITGARAEHSRTQASEARLRGLAIGGPWKYSANEDILNILF